MSIKIYAAPLQGFTDYRFRNAFEKHFGGVTAYYAPYIRLDSKQQIKPSVQRDITPANNSGIKLVPQVMSKSADEMLYLADYLRDLGYTKMDWNLGCPYPMVAKRGLGSGLLREPELIASILRQLTRKSSLQISLKMRLGYESPDEILKTLPLLNDIPLQHITIHPRIGKQLYKGEVDLESFEQCLNLSEHTLVYNGDIHRYEQFEQCIARFPSLQHFMLGRGLLCNPFLPVQIQQNKTDLPKNWQQTFATLHKELMDSFAETLSGDKHLIQRMYAYWEYFMELFPGNKKGLKKIKKARNRDEYWLAVTGIIN